MEKEIERLEKEVKDYRKLKALSQKQKDRIDELSLDVDKQKGEKERMRKTFHKELMVYKQKEMNVIHNFNSRHLKEGDFVPIQFYDSI